MIELVTKCINCGGKLGKGSTNTLGIFHICKRCNDAGDKMEQTFKKGVDVEYTDGTKETWKID